MIRFRFALTPMDRVLAWGSPEAPRLHWFGLTDGWYWIELGDRELLRYAPRTLAVRQSGSGPAAPPHPYVDYYVARFWEDLLALAQAADEPVPAGLDAFAASDPGQWHGRDRELDWGDEVRAAASWHDQHSLDFGYLGSPPSIWAWRTTADRHDNVTVTWRHPGHEVIEFTAGSLAQATVPAGTFRAAVRQFDVEFMAAMGRRVAELERAGPPAGVEVDLERLQAEQQDRTTWLSKRLQVEPRTDWAAVRAGAAQLLRQ
jgi:hypothetical protein